MFESRRIVESFWLEKTLKINESNCLLVELLQRMEVELRNGAGSSSLRPFLQLRAFLHLTVELVGVASCFLLLFFLQ